MMLTTLGFLALLGSTPLDVRTPALALAPIAAHADAPAPLRLHSPLLERAERSAQHAQTGASEAPASSEAPAADASAAPAAEGDQAAAAPEEEEPSIDLMRMRARATRMHRPLGFAALGSLFVTEIAGTIMAANQRTLFGPGACNFPVDPASTASPCILGSYGGAPLTGFHEVSAFITAGFYIAAGAYAVGMPDPEHSSVGNTDQAHRLRVHRALAYVHLVGMILMPILGILAVYPELVGLHVDPANLDASQRALQDYQATLRTVHLGVGYVTLGAMTVAMAYQVAF